jgi:DNA-binding CsgD family transcriptional regulator
MAVDIEGMDGFDSATPFGLNEIQLAILAECASGGSMRSAARRLHYSYGRISHQLQSARRMMGAKSIPQACLIAHHRGMISSPTGSDLRSVPLIQ